MNIKKIIRDIVYETLLSIHIKSHKKHFIKEKSTVTSLKLTKSQLKEIKSFYKPYFKLNTTFHSFYTEKTGKFDVNYIPEDIWYTSIDRFYNNRDKAIVLDHKSYYERMFPSNIIKQAKTIVHRINGFWYDSSMKMISKTEVDEIIKEEEELFVKVASESCGGHGVFHITNKEDILREFNKVTDNNVDIIVQHAIKQHQELNKVGKSAVNTVRVLSMLTDKGVKIYSTILRMGIGNAKVDNASSGGITCGIKENGQLKDVAYTMLGKKFDCHPTTKVKFSEVTVPSYDKILDAIKKLHPSIPSFRMVSWDVAIDENAEPVLVEANLCMGQLDFHQLNNGPIFKEDTKKILDEVFNKK